MLYIVGTKIDTTKPTERVQAYAVNKKLSPRKNSIFPEGRVWELGRIYKDQESDKIVYDFYNNSNPTDVINLKFSTCEEADQAIARARGEKIVDDDAKVARLTSRDIQEKYAIAEQMQKRTNRPMGG